MMVPIDFFPDLLYLVEIFCRRKVLVNDLIFLVSHIVNHETEKDTSKYFTEKIDVFCIKYGSNYNFYGRFTSVFLRTFFYLLT